MEERAKKSFNITALKEWEEAGEPFEEDDVILAYLEYKRNEARKNGANPGTEPEDITLSMAENKHLERLLKNAAIELVYARVSYKTILYWSIDKPFNRASFNSRTYAYATTAVNNLQSSPPIMIAFSQTKAALPPSRQTLAA
ncbi:9332_t:CDS:2, partial [Rhizophagus irregularis]